MYYKENAFVLLYKCVLFLSCCLFCCPFSFSYALHCCGIVLSPILSVCSVTYVYNIRRSLLIAEIIIY